MKRVLYQCATDDGGTRGSLSALCHDEIMRVKVVNQERPSASSWAPIIEMMASTKNMQTIAMRASLIVIVKVRKLAVYGKSVFKDSAT